MADVPLGMFLSGGLDSSAIAAMMARMIDRPLQTFSVAFEQRAFSELDYARQVATAIGADAHEVVIDDQDFFGALPRLIWHEDEPIAHPSSVPLYFVSALARQHVKVVLTGEGSDELLAGYAKYPKALVNWRAASAYGAVPSPLRHWIADTLVPSLPARLGRMAQRSFLAMPRTPEAMFFDNFAGIGLKRQAALLSPAACGATRRRNGGLWTLARLLRQAERDQHDARPAALYRSQNVSGRTADEAGPDEHGGVDREPRAVPRSQARRVRGRASRANEASRIQDQVDPPRSGPRDPPGRDPHAQEDGLPGAVRRLDEGRMGQRRARRPARLAKPRARHHRRRRRSNGSSRRTRPARRTAAMRSGACSTWSSGTARTSTATACRRCPASP